MKKSEMDKLRELLRKHRGSPGLRTLFIVSELSELLDTFEVDPPSAKETKKNLGWTGPEHEPEEAFINAGYKKEMHGSTPVLTKPIESERSKKVIVNLDPEDFCCEAEKKPKRKWVKWSELKDRFFSKKKQKEMKEQAEKELEEQDNICPDCKHYDTCEPDRNMCDYESRVCPDCEGLGIVVSYGYEPDPTKTCPKCKGTGYKETKPYRPTHKCKVCKGSGWAGYFICRTCRGTGQAENKDE